MSPILSVHFRIIIVGPLPAGTIALLILNGQTYETDSIKEKKRNSNDAWITAEVMLEHVRSNHDPISDCLIAG